MPPDPLEMPDAFWLLADVRRALADRDVGMLLRLVAEEVGASQTQIGAAVGLDQGYVSRVMAGRKVTSIDVLERVADGLEMPDSARSAMGLADGGSAAAHAAVRQLTQPVGRSWRDDVRAGTDLWRGDVKRRDVLRQTGHSAPAGLHPAGAALVYRATSGTSSAERHAPDRAAGRRDDPRSDRDLPSVGQPIRRRSWSRCGGPLSRPRGDAAPARRPLRRCGRPRSPGRHGRAGAARGLAGVRHRASTGSPSAISSSRSISPARQPTTASARRSWLR